MKKRLTATPRAAATKKPPSRVPSNANTALGPSMETTAKIVASLTQGKTLSDAFREAGVKPKLGYSWFRRGNRGDTACRDFALAMSACCQARIDSLKPRVQEADEV